MTRRQIIERAYQQAVDAGKAKREELERQGPQYELYETIGLSDTRKPNGARYQILDVVGNAWLIVNGRSGFYGALKALYDAGDRRFYVGNPQHIGIRAYAGQEASCNEAATQAFASVLNAHDSRVNARVRAYID